MWQSTYISIVFFFTPILEDINRDRYSYRMSWCQATYAFSSFSACISDTGYLHINLESSSIIFGPRMSFTGFRMLLCVAIWKTHCCFMWMLWKEYWEACLPGKDIYRLNIHEFNTFLKFEQICQLVRINIR